VKRLALLALLLASSSAAAAPAPLPKPQRKAERPAVVIRKVAYVRDNDGLVLRVNRRILAAQQLGVPLLLPPPPAQPPSADPPG
jgi:endonuclease YncB( thermonuclease family)